MQYVLGAVNRASILRRLVPTSVHLLQREALGLFNRGGDFLPVGIIHGWGMWLGWWH
jgi:hypothetical protein